MIDQHEPCPGCGILVDPYGSNYPAVLNFCSTDCRKMVRNGSSRSTNPADGALSMLVALLSAFVFAGVVLVAYQLIQLHL